MARHLNAMERGSARERKRVPGARHDISLMRSTESQAWGFGVQAGGVGEKNTHPVVRGIEIAGVNAIVALVKVLGGVLGHGDLACVRACENDEVQDGAKQVCAGPRGTALSRERLYSLSRHRRGPGVRVTGRPGDGSGPATCTMRGVRPEATLARALDAFRRERKTDIAARSSPGRIRVGDAALQARPATCGRRTRSPNTCVRAPPIPQGPKLTSFCSRVLKLLLLPQ